MFTWENSHRCKFHTGMTFWFRNAFTWRLGHFISRYLKVHFMLIKYTCDSKSQALHMRYLFQSTNRPISVTSKRVVVSRLHDTAARFRTGVKFSPRYKNRGKLTTGWLAPAWHFVVVSCKQIKSHEREPEWTRSGAKVAPVSCKHDLPNKAGRSVSKQGYRQPRFHP